MKTDLSLVDKRYVAVAGLQFDIQDGIFYDNGYSPLVDEIVSHPIYREPCPQLELPLTFRCNLACSYCVFNKRRKEMVMSLDASDDNLTKSIAIFFEYIRKIKQRHIRVDFSTISEPFFGF